MLQLLHAWTILLQRAQLRQHHTVGSSQPNGSGTKQEKRGFSQVLLYCVHTVPYRDLSASVPDPVQKLFDYMLLQH